LEFLIKNKNGLPNQRQLRRDVSYPFGYALQRRNTGRKTILAIVEDFTPYLIKNYKG